jgi:hypothetical protein
LDNWSSAARDNPFGNEIHGDSERCPDRVDESLSRLTFASPKSAVVDCTSQSTSMVKERCSNGEEMESGELMSPRSHFCGESNVVVPPGHFVPPTLRSGWQKVVYQSLGCLCVGLAFVGAFLPGLPTTPFLLLASYLFFRSSPGLYAWLYRNPLAGPMLRQWERDRGVGLLVKLGAIAVVLVMLGLTVAFSPLPYFLKVIVCILGSVGVGVIACLPAPRAACEPWGGSAIVRDDR